MVADMGIAPFRGLVLAQPAAQHPKTNVNRELLLTYHRILPEHQRRARDWKLRPDTRFPDLRLFVSIYLSVCICSASALKQIF